MTLRNFDEQPQNPYDLSAERALSSQNQQQRFTFNGLWNLPIPGQIELDVSPSAQLDEV